MKEQNHENYKAVYSQIILLEGGSCATLQSTLLKLMEETKAFLDDDRGAGMGTLVDEAVLGIPNGRLPPIPQILPEPPQEYLSYSGYHTFYL